IRYLEAHHALVATLDIEELYGKRRNILVLTSDAITERMAGPAIRAWNMADVLGGEHNVRLVTMNAYFDPPSAPFEVKYLHPAKVPPEVAWADIVVMQGHALEQVEMLKSTRKIVVCDIYDPMHLEQLEQGKDLTDTRRAHVVEVVTEVLTNQLLRGDFFLCASDRQRHFWLGHLGAIGRLSPTLYDSDPSVRSLLAIAPFGLSAKPPQRTGSGPRELVTGIGQDDKVIIWAGGIYNWFDPLTLLHAVERLRRKRPDVKLLFLGMKHPNPDVGEMDMAIRARALAAKLNLTGRNVFFNETWVPFDQRQNWLMDADCGVTTHYEHVETTFAFRTRVLDYLWAGLPIVSTAGDSFADLVERERLGVVVPSEDPDALAEALEKVLYDDEFARDCRGRIEAVRERYTWETVLAPLVEFCRNPRPAADRLTGVEPLVLNRPLGATGTLRRDWALVKEYLNAGGPAELAKRAGGRLRRVLGQGR
ncbi:MAG: glycosyltransferase family 4 protein, partial [Kibdelosporangium sp.]